MMSMRTPDPFSMLSNAYTDQTAIYGSSFCVSAKKAFFLILRNIVRIAAVSIVGDFVLLLGKVNTRVVS
jgi:choline transporter-like protein 2/4/5